MSDNEERPVRVKMRATKTHKFPDGSFQIYWVDREYVVNYAMAMEFIHEGWAKKVPYV